MLDFAIRVRAALQGIFKHSKPPSLPSVGTVTSLSSFPSMAATKVIIDTDAGTDDALALFMALQAHQRGCLEVVAITTVFGNTFLTNVNDNVARILRLTDMQQIPVYSGASQSLVYPYQMDDKPYHGHDGFGDSDLPPQPPPSSLLQPRHAVLALLDLVKQHSGEVVLVALGPLTNLALAMRLDPAFTSHLAGLYIMGGNSEGTGNITPFAEFNFYSDVEAAFVVLEESSITIRLTPWEICSRDGTFPDSMREEWGEINTAVADLMNKIEMVCRAFYDDNRWVTCDQLAMAWVIDDAKNKILEAKGSKENGSNCMGFLGEPGKPLVADMKTCYASVEVYDNKTRGKMLCHSKSDRKPNVTFMEKVNISLYKKYISMAFGADV